MAKYKPPKVFISYAWEDDIKPWVLDLATQLRRDGVETILDQWETHLGDQLTEFMEKSVRRSDFVIIICTPKYKAKSDEREGGVGYEGHIITSEIFQNSNHRKFIPVLRKGNWKSASPSWAAGKLYIDLSGNPYSKENYQDLLRTLHGKKYVPPPVGKPPDFPGIDDYREPKKVARDEAKRENSEQLAARVARIKEIYYHTVSTLKSIFKSSFPVLRVIGILGVIAVLFWGGSLVIPDLVALISTLEPTATITLTPTKLPTATKTKILTSTPTPVLTEITDDLGVEMVLVLAGEFTMGEDVIDAWTECQKWRYDCHLDWFENLGPKHQVYLDSFYMDKYEVTKALYKNCVDEEVCEQPIKLSSHTHSDYFENPDFDDYPVIYVNWEMANTFCEWREMRLPTEAEWEKAARGTDGRYYPWGEELPGCDYSNLAQMCKGDTAKVGSFIKDVSPYDVYDMAGNVTEWVADWYLEKYYEISPDENPLGPEAGEARVLRGDNWTNSKITPEQGKIYQRGAGWVTQSDYYLARGFRCAKDVTP